MNKPLLTIAIPTYNRVRILKENLAILIPQLDEDCHLLIVDNCSDQSVEEEIGPLFAHLRRDQYTYKRNPVNIGGPANVLRCFELVNSEWVWLLADDDDVMVDAIKNIKKNIIEHSDCIFINFYSNVDKFIRPATFLTVGKEEFIDKIDSFSNILFLSCGVYKHSAIINNLKIGYRYSYSLAPHTALLIYSLNITSKVCFSMSQLVSWKREEEGGSLLDLVLHLPTLIEIQMSSRSHKRLGEKILGLFDYSLSRKRIFLEVFKGAVASGDFVGSRYFYDQICLRMHYFERSVRHRISLIMYRIMLRCPRLTFAAISIAYRIFKQKKFVVESINHFHRM